MPASILDDSNASGPIGVTFAPASAARTFGASAAPVMIHTSASPVSPPPLTSLTGISPSVATTCDQGLSGGRTPVSRSLVSPARGPTSTKSACSRDTSSIATFSEKR